MENIFDLLQERSDLWTYLQRVQKPILLYGMGDGGIKIIKYLREYGVDIAGVFASDEFVRGHSFCGHQVLSYNQAKKEFGNFVVLVAFGTSKPEVIANIHAIAKEQETYAPNVPLFGEGLFNTAFVQGNSDKFLEVYHMLADQKSQEVFLAMCNYGLSGKLEYLSEATTDKAEADLLLDLSDEETYVDLGAYNGDTVQEFVKLTKGNYRKILALEPDKKNYKKLMQNSANYDNIYCVNQGIWHENTVLEFAAKAGRNSTLQQNGGKRVAVSSLDYLCEQYLSGELPTYIKMDVEGAEAEALLGAGKVLANQPKLLVSAYHRNEDLFSLPLLIKKACPDYRLYLRHHLYIPGWDTNFYAI